MSEARTGKRFPLHLPITIYDAKSKKHKGTTTNLSAAGVYIHADAPFEVGSNVEFEITLPIEVTGTTRPVEIRCRGRVVRSDGKLGREAAPPKKAPKAKARKQSGGVACVIDHYKFVRK